MRVPSMVPAEGELVGEGKREGQDRAPEGPERAQPQTHFSLIPP